MMARSMPDMVYDLIVIGGGIAGVTCCESISFLRPESSILLISASSLVKAVINYKQLTRTMEEFDVTEKPAFYLEEQFPNITVINDVATGLDSKRHCVYTGRGKEYYYKKICLCSGGTPKIIDESNPCVLGIRDTESVDMFQTKLSKAKRVVVLGNGGIASELVYELENVDIIWAIKDSSINAAFVDAGAAQFFLSVMNDDKSKEVKPMKRLKYTLAAGVKDHLDVNGSALGPDWHSSYKLKGGSKSNRNITIEYEVEITRLLTPDEFKCLNLKDSPSVNSSSLCSWPVYIQLSNGKVFGCDFVVSATGVTPFTSPFLKNNNFHVSCDGGFSVNQKMETNVVDVYAAGDVCTPSWEYSKHWLQMRLWTQARQMGIYAGKCISAALDGDEVTMDFCFEIFTHVTKFFNYKVVLLGRFNGQGLGSDYNILLRTTHGLEYVKTVMQNGRMQGAILIGETNLEETFENLILNQMDLTRYGEDLLHPDIDIEDYFD